MRKNKPNLTFCLTAVLFQIQRETWLVYSNPYSIVYINTKSERPIKFVVLLGCSQYSLSKKPMLFTLFSIFTYSIQFSISYPMFTFLQYINMYLFYTWVIIYHFREIVPCNTFYGLSGGKKRIQHKYTSKDKHQVLPKIPQKYNKNS